MRCPFPRIIPNPKWTLGSSEPQGFQVPCGHCLACRLAKRQEWVTRLICEYEYWDKAAFITLTYDDDHLPISPSGESTLLKRDVQLFFKRLRKYFFPLKICYFCCGEYSGANTKRPHYHAIVFGLDFFQLRFFLKDIWQCGRVSSDPVSVEDMRYVAGYVEKKLYGELAKEEYRYLYSEPIEVGGRSRKVFSRFPPFSLCSNGIGKRYALDHRDELMRDFGVMFRGRNLGFPRYFRKVLEIPKEVMYQHSLDAEFEVDYELIKGGLHDVLDIEYAKKAGIEQSYYTLLCKRKNIRRDKI